MNHSTLVHTVAKCAWNCIPMDAMTDWTLICRFLCVKSEYDGILPWPFDKKVTITLIDQQPCPKLRRNIHMCSYPRNDGHFSPCYSRPVEERAQNIAFGFCKFVTQEQLKTRHYIVSDTLFFCVEVDTLIFIAIVIPVFEKDTGLCGKNWDKTE